MHRLPVYVAAYVPELLDREFENLNTRRIVGMFEELPKERQEDLIRIAETFWRDTIKPPTGPKEIE